MKQVSFIYVAMMINHVIFQDDNYKEKSHDYLYIINLLCLFIATLSTIIHAPYQPTPHFLRTIFKQSTELWYTSFIILFLHLGTISFMIIDSSITTLFSIIPVKTSSSPIKTKHTYHRSWKHSFIFPSTWCLLSYIMLSPSVCGQLFKNNFQYFHRIQTQGLPHYPTFSPAYYLQLYNEFLRSPTTDINEFLSNPPASLLHLTGYGPEFHQLLQQNTILTTTLSQTSQTPPPPDPIVPSQPQPQPSLVRTSELHPSLGTCYHLSND
jgi:hypothetical protein